MHSVWASPACHICGNAAWAYKCVLHMAVVYRSAYEHSSVTDCAPNDHTLVPKAQMIIIHSTVFLLNFWSIAICIPDNMPSSSCLGPCSAVHHRPTLILCQDTLVFPLCMWKFMHHLWKLIVCILIIDTHGHQLLLQYSTSSKLHRQQWVARQSNALWASFRKAMQSSTISVSVLSLSVCTTVCSFVLWMHELPLLQPQETSAHK